MRTMGSHVRIMYVNDDGMLLLLVIIMSIDTETRCLVWLRCEFGCNNVTFFYSDDESSQIRITPVLSLADPVLADQWKRRSNRKTASFLPSIPVFLSMNE